MTDDDLTGPWVLALGALAIGVAAADRLLRQRETSHEDTPPERKETEAHRRSDL